MAGVGLGYRFCERDPKVPGSPHSGWWRLRDGSSDEVAGTYDLSVVLGRMRVPSGSTPRAAFVWVCEPLQGDGLGNGCRGEISMSPQSFHCLCPLPPQDNFQPMDQQFPTLNPNTIGLVQELRSGGEVSCGGASCHSFEKRFLPFLISPASFEGGPPYWDTERLTEKRRTAFPLKLVQCAGAGW